MTQRFESYFRDYAAACNEFDAQRLADFFHCPCLMVNGDFVATLDSEDAIRSNMEALLRHHREQGYGRASVSDIDVSHPGGNLVFVSVRWRIVQADGSPLWNFRNTYNLVDHGDGWKILVSTTHPDPA